MDESPRKPNARYGNVERSIFERNIKPRITPEVIGEHRDDPFGAHSPDLEIVLRYLRRDPIKTEPRYLIVSPAPYERYCIAEHSRVRGVPLQITDECYRSEEDAQHAIFIRRLRALHDRDVDRVLDQVS